MPSAQTVTVVNQSGKVVKNSKYLAGVWKETQAAYRERKAEIKAIRKSSFDEDQKKSALKNLDADDAEVSSAASSRRSSFQSSKSVARKPVATSSRPTVERIQTDTSSRSHRSHRSDRDSPRSPRSPHSSRSPNSPRTPKSPRKHGQSKLRFEDRLEALENESKGKELVRRNTDGMLRANQQLVLRPKSSRSASMTELEMSLAYGEAPPLPKRRTPEEIELRAKVSKLQQLLDEANCVQHSALAMVESLAKNPDQLAAVALSLAEISAMAAKMAPAALKSAAAASPATFALLASPQFAMAAGVGVGVTVIALGSYKVIKRIQKKKKEKKAIADAAAEGQEEGDEDEEFGEDELQEIRSDLDRIELWRRGIADAQAQSVGTSVDGEFVTPGAKEQLIEGGKLKESDLKSKKSVRRTKTKREKSKKDDGKEETKDEKKKREKEGEKEKKKRRNSDDVSVLDKGKALIQDPNGIRSLFKKNSTKKSEMSMA